MDKFPEAEAHLSTCRVGTTLVEAEGFIEEDMVHKLKVSEAG